MDEPPRWQNPSRRQTDSNRQHPLVKLLRQIRLNHPEHSMSNIEACMNIPFGTLRHIEGGRHLLPNLQHGLGRWIRKYLECMGATPEEKKAVEELASKVILFELSDEQDEGNGPLSSS